MPELALPELEKRVRGLLQATLDRREPVLTRFPGILGLSNTAGSAQVSGKPGWVYVRIGNDETVATAFNNRTNNRNGLPVIVGYDPAQPNLFQVLSTREVYEGEWASGGALPNHHGQHEYGNATGGDDIVWIRMRQLTDLLVYPTDPESLSVNIASGNYIIGTTVYNYAGGTLDLTSSVPGTSRRWVLIAMDESGPYTVEGSVGSYAYSDIPDTTDPTHYKLAAVLLKAGDTEITDWPSTVRFVDLRLAGSRSMAASGGYVEWENVALVAKAGGNYSTVAAGIASLSGNKNTVWVLTGSYAENVNVNSLANTLLRGMADRGGVSRITGADDTGPMLTISIDGVTVTSMHLDRDLTSGSAEFVGIDASSTSYFLYLEESWVEITDTGVSRDVTCVHVSGTASDPSVIERCTLLASGDGANQHAVELNGNTVWIRDCKRIEGDIVDNAGTELYLMGCHVTGDVTGTTGGDLYIDQATVVTGTISGWDSVTVIGKYSIDHDHSGDTGDGGQLDHGAALTTASRQDDDHTHYLLNWDNVRIVHPAGATRTGQYYTSIQGAINASSSGDVVLVMPGNYTEDISLADGVIVSGLVIGTGDPFGAAGTDTVRITGQITAGDVQTLVANLTVDHEDSSAGVEGAFSWTTTSSKRIELYNVILAGNNLGAGYGAGLYLSGGGQIFCYNCKFGSEAATAGQAYSVLLENSSEPHRLVNCEFDQTYGDVDLYTDETVELVSCTFDPNKVSISGGTVNVYGFGTYEDQAFAVKLFDNAGASTFQVQDSDEGVVFGVNSNGHAGVGAAASASYQLTVEGAADTNLGLRVNQDQRNGEATVYGAHVTVDPTGATACYGIYVSSVTGAATSAFGLRILSVSGATDNWGLYIDGGDKNYFAADVGIGGTPVTSALLTLTSTTGALLLTRMTTTQRNALTATNGMVIYNTTTGQVEAYTGGSWSAL